MADPLSQLAPPPPAQLLRSSAAAVAAALLLLSPVEALAVRAPALTRPPSCPGRLLRRLRPRRATARRC